MLSALPYVRSWVTFISVKTLFTGPDMGAYRSKSWFLLRLNDGLEISTVGQTFSIYVPESCALTSSSRAGSCSSFFSILRLPQCDICDFDKFLLSASGNGHA